MPNNMPETMTKQQSYHEKENNRISAQKKVNSIMKKRKKGYKKQLVINGEDYLKKKKIRKENAQEISTGMYLKKTSKN